MTGSNDDGTIIARHARHKRTVAITPDYVKEHTVLAYGATIAGAQGRTTDTGHVLVTPRTNAASLYVGMTRGRQTNHAHVVTDGHDHGELDLGHKSGFHGFADALQRNPDGDTSATTVRKNWAAGEAERKAARQRDRIDSANRQLWSNAKLTLPKAALPHLDGRDDQVVRALAHSQGSTPTVLRFAIQGTDWRQPDAAVQFVKLIMKKPTSTRLAPHEWQAHTSSRHSER